MPKKDLAEEVIVLLLHLISDQMFFPQIISCFSVLIKKFWLFLLLLLLLLLSSNLTIDDTYLWS